MLGSLHWYIESIDYCLILNCIRHRPIKGSAAVKVFDNADVWHLAPLLV